jgi:small subunit ribosomal protein S4e
VSIILHRREIVWLSVSRITNIFVIGDSPKPWVTLPKGKGIKLTIAEERDVRRKRAAESQ